eukprot:10221382-Lingulodinium_polyedra.AAC.1
MPEALRARQVGTVAAVASKVHVAFLPVAVVLLTWPGHMLPERFITGFSNLGTLERTGVFRLAPLT